MDPEQQVARVAQRMREAGFAVTPNTMVGFTPVLAGHTSAFRWRWMATKLHLLVYVQPVESVTVAGLERFTHECLEHALGAKGSLRGLQVAVAVASVQVGASVSPGARRYAEHEIVNRIGALAWPVTIDATSSVHSRHAGRPAIGAIYTSWIRQQIDRVAAGA